MKKYDIIILSGGFDPVHRGHINLLKAAKNMAHKVIVGINSDSWLVNKKSKTFMNWAERAEIVGVDNRLINFVLWMPELFENKKKDGISASGNVSPRMMDKFFSLVSTINDFERHPKCKQLIDIYIDLEYTPIERLYEGLKRDIEDILKRIDTIPYEKEIMVEFESEVDLGKGEKDIKKFKQRVIIDNSEEKEKKMELAIKLFDYDKKLQSKMFDESKEKRRSITAKFDKIPDKERSLSLSL